MNRSSTSYCRIGQLSLIIAMILACHAAIAAFTSGHHAGCVEGGTCAEVLSSKWSMVMEIPVALFAVALYLVTLVLSVTGSSGRLNPALRCCGALILMAAAYFVVIQAFLIGSVCALCMTIHGFAVLGVISIVLGNRAGTSALSFSGPREALPVLLAAGCLGGLVILQSLDIGDGRARQVRMVADEGQEFPKQLLFTPFIAKNGGVGVALDGGKLPIFGAEIPEIPLGRNASLPPLQVVLLNDWTCAHCVELHARLHRIYHSPGSASLPPVTLRLLPVFFDAKAEAAHRAMLNVHFGTGNPAAFPTIAEDIAFGRISPDPFAIRARFAEIDSGTASRWETLPAILEESVSQAFALAKSQMLLNSSHLKVSSLPQLTVFDAVLAGLPSESGLADFLRAAAARQQSMLDSPRAPAAPEMDATCGCEHPEDSSDHVHGPSCGHASGAHGDADPVNNAHESSGFHALTATPHGEVNGARIEFDSNSVRTRPVAMGEAVEAVFEFRNTGNRVLTVHTVHTGCGCLVAHDWSREVQPGERGRISFTYDSKANGAAGLGEHIRHVWVASDSVDRTDPSYGDPLEITIPVTRPASQPGT